MLRTLRWLMFVVLLVTPGLSLHGETVDGLPAPTGYVNDFAGVLSAETRQSVEDLCTQVDQKAHAQIAVITVKSIDPDKTGATPSIEEFATALEDKWKVGAKGTDRGVLLLFVMTPRHGRIEVGYGLEGILNDAKVGDIGRSMVPAATQGDYNTAIPLGVNQIAQVIATDAGVTLTQPIYQYRRQRAPAAQLSLTQLLIGGGAILLILFFLVKTGNTGLIFFLLGSLMGGGGGDGRGRDNDGDGGGFGGFGGGGSGGGGASGDF